MGDGSIAYHESKSNPNLRINCVVPEYLEHLSKEFGQLSNSVFLSTPEMWQYRDWYTHRTTDSGAQYSKKVWPEDLELTPETLTHWFCGDGNNQFDYPSIRLSMNNERQNLDKVESYFEQARLPTPDRWGITDAACNAVWRKGSSEELFEYMEGPVPGYEYKWPDSVK